jgi:hypothetical protein
MGNHLLPFRTEKLSPLAPMVLQLWESRSSPNFSKPRTDDRGFFFILVLPMFRNNILFLALSFLTCASLLAQEEDVPKPVLDTSRILREYQLNSITKKADSVLFDTTMQEFHTYNPIYKYSFSNEFLGNTGQAFQSNDINLRTAYSPFIFNKPFDPYFHNPFNISHFNTRKPFTQIEYVSFGSKNKSEQVIKALHTQNVNKYTNFGILYDLIASKGIYLYQGTKTNRISFFGSYDKNAYSVYGSINLNSLTQKENGGLIDIPQFEKHLAKDPISYGMLLDNAESTTKKNTVFFTQTLDILKKSRDTSSLKKKEETLFHLNHTFSYSKYYKIYNDQISNTDTLDFYANNYYLINSAYDSAFTQIVGNSFQISGDQYKFLPGFIAGIKHQYQRFGYLAPFQTHIMIDTILVDTIIAGKKSSAYNNLSIFFSILDNGSGRFHYNASAEYFFAGYRQNDIISDFLLSYSSKSRKSSITVSANFYLTEPDFFLKTYSSSHFLWSNQFSKMTNTGAKIALERNTGRFRVSARLNLLGNFIYLDTMAIPVVEDKSILLSCISLEKRFKWKGFNQINKILIQKSNNDAAIQIPLLAYQNTSYYENAFFKEALKFQIGFDFYYNTSYYADAFMPATGMFYRQNKREVGNYPFLDAFLNWKIRRTRFFLKYTNSLSGIAGYNYFTTYGYPMNSPALKFGLSWTFYD